MLKVENLKRHFGGVKAVDGASFDIERGKITALIGPNGSGKTTIFNLISGVLKAESGKILFEDLDITNKSPEKIANMGVSRLFQQSRLFSNLTVRENLLLAFDNEDTKFFKNILGLNKVTKDKEEKIKDILKTVKMERFLNRTSRELSFGQKRLVEIGRAMLKPHKLLILDEPVAGVTPSLRDEIARILKELRKQGETIMLIEHDMNFTLKIADEVVVLDEGKVIVEDKPSRIRTNKKVLEAYLGD
ncbi:MAG: ABC transporter ATP-binding protein [archaeon]